MAARMRPMTAAATILPVTMLVRLTGRVRSVSSVLFSFSMAMDMMTMLPAMMMIIIMTMGMSIDCEERTLMMTSGERPVNSLPLKMVVWTRWVGARTMVALEVLLLVMRVREIWVLTMAMTPWTEPL